MSEVKPTEPTAQDLRGMTKGLRIAAFDYGRKRVGWAVCDEFHISISTKGVLQRTAPGFWSELLAAMEHERVGFVLVGMPLRTDAAKTPLMAEIRKFIKELKRRSNLNVLEWDEAFTSRRAVETMLQIGVKKSQRRERERKDEISAAIILRDFLTETEL